MRRSIGEGVGRAWWAAALAIVLVAALHALVLRRAAASVDYATVEAVLAELAAEPALTLTVALARRGIEADAWGVALRRWAACPVRLRRFRAGPSAPTES
jgi:hypothetical protein